MISGSVSLPCSGFFSPFPHGTGPLSVSREYLALRDGPRGFTPDFSCPALLQVPPRLSAAFAYRPLTSAGSIPSASATLACAFDGGSITPARAETPPVWGSARSLATTCAESLLFSSPPGTEMFQFPVRLRLAMMWESLYGLPHSEIRGSTGICLAAAYRSCHVLLRLRE